MKKKMKSLRLKKLQIASLNLAYIKGGTNEPTTTPAQTNTCADCDTQSDPVITVCTSIGQLKPLERVGAECKAEVLGSQQQSPSQECRP